MEGLTIKKYLINVYEGYKPYQCGRHKTVQSADVAVFGFPACRENYGLIRAAGKLLRSAGVAYRLRVTLKDRI